MIGLVLAFAGAARAQMTDPPPRDQVQWQVEIVYDLVADGHHLGVSWKRVPERTQGVLVLRRALPAGTVLDARPVRAIDHPGPLLVPTFVYPSTKNVYHPAFDARTNPIPAGAKVGEWTVVAYAPGDPAQPIVDEVEADTPYVYALIPATPGPDPGTYVQFGDAILTESVIAEAGWFHRWRWVLVGSGAIVALALVVVVARRRSSRRAAAG